MWGLGSPIPYQFLSKVNLFLVSGAVIEADRTESEHVEKLSDRNNSLAFGFATIHANNKISSSQSILRDLFIVQHLNS